MLLRFGRRKIRFLKIALNVFSPTPRVGMFIETRLYNEGATLAKVEWRIDDGFSINM
jgi:hypothetical protein